MKRILVLLIATFSLATLANAQQGVAIGSPIDNFALPGSDGKTQELNSLRGRSGTVVVFLSGQCPAVEAYRDRINQAAASARDRGINFIGIQVASGSQTSQGSVASSFRFPVLHDRQGSLAVRLGAFAAPEVFFADADNVLQYRGAIDSNRRGDIITQNYLLAAVDENLADKPVSVKSVHAVGCAIKRSER